MAFQPFGYPVTLTVHASREDIKQRLKANVSFPGNIVQDGTVRGWIFLRGFCLWSSHRKDGPMVFGRVARQGEVSILKIRAGSDLNFVIPMSIFVVFGALVYLFDWVTGTPLPNDNRLFLLVSAVAAILLLFAHFTRFEANHMVQFLIDTLSPYRVEGYPP